MEEEVLAGFQNVTISAPGHYQCDYELNKMQMVIDASQIFDVTPKLHIH